MTETGNEPQKLPKEEEGIHTFTRCGYRVEEILHSKAFEMPLGGVTTDPGLLDWSECTHPNLENIRRVDMLLRKRSYVLEVDHD